MRNGVLEINGVAVKKERIADLVIPVNAKICAIPPTWTATPSRAGVPTWRKPHPAVAHNADTRGFAKTLPERTQLRKYLISKNGLEGDNSEAFVVGEGDLFLMGDNRDRSADSRWTPIDKPGAIGIVPQENLVGRALVSVFSTDGSSHWLLPWTWFTAARWERIGKGF